MMSTFFSAASMAASVCAMSSTVAAKPRLPASLAARPVDECFAGFLAILEDAEGFFHQRGDFARVHAFEDLAGDALLVAHPAAHHDVVGLGAIGKLHADESDVTAVMLRAGMRAAGEVEIHGLAEIDPPVQVLRQRHGVRFGITGGIFA